jgi:DNA-binding CsgD family transcriptional regulator
MRKSPIITHYKISGKYGPAHAMKHLYVLYFFSTLLVGVGSLAIATFIHLKTKEKTVRYYLYFYVPFTLVVVFFTAISYLEANVPTISSSVLSLLEYLGTLNLLSLLFVVPLSVHHFTSTPQAARRNLFFGGMALAVMLAYHVFEFVLGSRQIAFIGEFVLSGIFIVVMVYCGILDVHHYTRIQDPVKKRFERRQNVFFMLSLPGLCHDMFLNELSAFRFYPILYCGMSVFFTLYFVQNYTHHQAPSAEQSLPPEDFFARCNISAREQDIVTLVVQGYSNQKIAETLFISLNTVKAHLRNIYPKFGITSRYELITLINNSDMNINPESSHQ